MPTYESLLAAAVSETRQARFAAVLSRRLSSLTLVCDRILDPHNISACLRSCDAFGLMTVHLLLDRTQRYRGNRQVSRYSDRWVEVRNHWDEEAMCSELSAAGFTLVGTVVADGEGVTDFRHFEPPERMALVVGNEHLGLSDSMRRRCQALLRIPTCGFVDSLNLSVATGILLEHFSDHCHRCGKGVLTDAEQRAWLEAWLEREVRQRLHKIGVTLEDVLEDEDQPPPPQE
ncbi:MAG: RNA methyltransferase [Oligosphaeraceae bacterium]|nr:RNA methyltransferase [Oligosphaeraceae bacterium]